MADLLSHLLASGDTLHYGHRGPLAEETVKHRFRICLCMRHVASLRCVTFFLKNGCSFRNGFQIPIIVLLPLTALSRGMPRRITRGGIKGRCPQLRVIVFELLLKVLYPFHQI